jgi:hypothetical protein
MRHALILRSSGRTYLFWAFSGSCECGGWQTTPGLWVSRREALSGYRRHRDEAKRAV